MGRLTVQTHHEDRPLNNPRLSLRFISGKYQGGEFPLKMDREVIIGRSSDLDMVLVEDMVSRQHAKITFSHNRVFIQDLGSTNGTFVNGEKIKKVRLNEGDRVLIGTSIIKLVSANEGPAIPPMPPPMPNRTSPRQTLTVARSMAGTIDEIPLPDLLQLLSTSKKSGVLQVQALEMGRIYLRTGQIYYATIDDSFDLSARKALYRMLTWESRTFELLPPDEKEFLYELDEPTEGLLMEAMRQMDEIKHMRGNLPDRSAFLVLANPMTAQLRDLEPELLDLLQLVHNNSQMKMVLDKNPTPDLETYKALMELFKGGYIAESK